MESSAFCTYLDTRHFPKADGTILHGLHWKTLLLYLDDVTVILPDFSSHLQRLEDVFVWLQDAGLKLKPTKCELLQDEVHYLGHVVGAKGLATDPDKRAAIGEWEVPKDLKALQAFLGAAVYYRQYIPDIATIAKLLTRLTSGDRPWVWIVEEQTAFQRLKDGLVSAPVLGYPDPTLPYILNTDASAVGVGAVLSQVQDGKERVIAYYSKILAPSERDYCVTSRELLAMVKAMKHFLPISIEHSLSYAQTTPCFIGYVDDMNLPLRRLAGLRSFRHSTINWSIERAGTMDMLTG